MAAELTCIRSILEHDMNAVKGGIESLNETEQNLPLGGKDGVKMIVSPKLQYNLFKLPIMFPHNLFKLYNTVVGGYVCADKNTVFLWSKVHAVKDSGGLALSKMDWLCVFSLPIS